MFGYFDFYGRNVKDLPSLVILCFDIGECCAAQVALLDLMQFDVIRFFHRFQCATNMPLLSTVLLVARLSLAFGAGYSSEVVAILSSGWVFTSWRV